MTKQKQVPAVTVNGLTVSYEQQVVLWEVGFSLPQGKLIGIIGPNGAGKSTLLKAIMALTPIRMGEIKLYGQSLKVMRKRLGYVPQRESLDWDFPISVREVVMMGRYGHMGLFKRASATDKTLVAEALAATNMEAYANRQIGALSGGQQQRVLLARCLAQQADLYLMDEPFAGVDVNTEQLLFSLLRNLCQAGKNCFDCFSQPTNRSQAF